MSKKNIKRSKKNKSLNKTRKKSLNRTRKKSLNRTRKKSLNKNIRRKKIKRNRRKSIRRIRKGKKIRTKRVSKRRRSIKDKNLRGINGGNGPQDIEQVCGEGGLCDYTNKPVPWIELVDLIKESLELENNEKLSIDQLLNLDNTWSELPSYYDQGLSVAYTKKMGYSSFTLSKF